MFFEIAKIAIDHCTGCTRETSTMCHQAAINRIRDIGCADMKTTDPARIVSIYGIKVVLVLTTR
jgi:hypothetical protein